MMASDTGGSRWCYCFRLKSASVLFSIMFFQLYAAGPGLAIRVICAEEPYVCKDFPETNNILKIVADFSASVKKVTKLLNSNIHKSTVIL